MELNYLCDFVQITKNTSMYRFFFLQLLDELGKELGELRQYKIEAEVRPRRDSQIQVQGRYQTLQTEIHRLKEVGYKKLYRTYCLAFDSY